VRLRRADLTLRAVRSVVQANPGRFQFPDDPPCTVPELLAQCVSWRFGCRAGSVQVVRLLYLTCAVPN
jgi:hypothetical protein